MIKLNLFLISFKLIFLGINYNGYSVLINSPKLIYTIHLGQNILLLNQQIETNLVNKLIF